MTPFAHQGDPNGEGTAPQRQFRIVDREVETPPEEQDAPEQGIRALISTRLLVSEDEWNEQQAFDPSKLHAKAVVPIVSSLCRIRSDADAALALTGVLEVLARRFNVELPCGDTEGSGFLFCAPAETDLEAVAEAIDEMLMGTVRASDLQGALRDRARARVTTANEGW